MMIQAVMCSVGGKFLPSRGVLRCTLGIYWVGIRQSDGYVAIDRGSGYFICKKKTFAECEAFICENAKRIAEIQETKSYRAQAERLRALLAKLHGGANNGSSNEKNQW